MFLPASFAIVPSLLSDDQLQAGNALSFGGTELATLIGPVIGGVVVALLGPSPAFGIDAVSFAVSVATLAGIRHRQRPLPATPTEAVPTEAVPTEVVSPAATVDNQIGTDTTVEAATEPVTLRRLVRSQRVLQVILVVTVAANLGSGGTSEVALPALAHDSFRTSAAGYGALLAAFGAGALLGTLLAGHTRRATRPAIWASAAYLAEAAFLASVPYLGGVIPAAGALAAYGALNGFANIITITAFQRWAPPAILGRLMGLLLLASFGIFPVSVLLGGLVVRDLGASAFFLLAAAILAIAVVGVLTQATWRAFGTETTARPETTPIRPADEPAG